PGRGARGDRRGGVLGRGAVAVLQVNRQGQLGRGGERGDVGPGVVERALSVAPAEAEREAAAGGREGPEAEARQDLGAAGVPGVRDDEGLALVEGAEGFGPLLLAQAHPLFISGRPRRPWPRRRATCLRPSSLVGRRDSKVRSSSPAVKRLLRSASQSAATGPQIRSERS